MNCKFTSDGKKVVVVGALNAKETIVQEIFVKDGTEFPAGEHFVVKTLLDAPAPTYKANEEQRLLKEIEQLKKSRDNLQSEIKKLNFDRAAAADRLKWVKGITEDEVAEVFDNLHAIIAGEYTHIFYPSNMRIEEWTDSTFVQTDSYSRDRYESIRLISLFGEWRGRLDMTWKVNTYRDGGGSNETFIPCRSLQEALDHAKEHIDKKEHLNDATYEFCLKYNIPIDPEKNAKRIADKKEYIQRQIKSYEDTLNKYKDALANIK